VPHMEISWDKRISLTAEEASQLLKKGSPSIAMSRGEGKPGLEMNSFMLQTGEDDLVAEQLVQLFRRHLA
jgi:hypothetical protein